MSRVVEASRNALYPERQCEKAAGKVRVGNLSRLTLRVAAGLRDRALIALMVYSFARIGAALGMKVEDVFTQNRRLWVRTILTG